MNNTEYHAHPAIGASGLRLINQAPAKYYAAYLDPDREPLEPTPAMIRGTMIHTACLEQHKFDEQYIAVPDGVTRQSKEGKELFAGIVASGKTPIKQEDAELARTLAGIWETRGAWRFQPLIIERSFFLNINGVEVKIRPDILIEPCASYPNGTIIDYKTTADASPTGWSKSIANYEYWIQSALYANVIQHLYQTDGLPDFYWFAQETEAPYLNKIYRATDAIQTYGWDECLRLLEIYHQCKDTDTWPGYGTDIEDAELPVWKQKEITASEGEIEVSYVK